VFYFDNPNHYDKNDKKGFIFMSEAQVLQSIARSKAAANRAVKALDINQLERAIKNLSAAAQTLKERDSQRAERKKELAVKKLKSMMDELGISAEDIVTPKKSVSTRKKTTGPKKGNKVAPKYQITADGQTHQWTGRGRTPIVFRKHVEQGGSLDDCLI
jgi:DNA-binding protein H-NS